MWMRSTVGTQMRVDGREKPAGSLPDQHHPDLALYHTAHEQSGMATRAAPADRDWPAGWSLRRCSPAGLWSPAKHRACIKQENPSVSLAICRQTPLYALARCSFPAGQGTSVSSADGPGDRCAWPSRFWRSVPSLYAWNDSRLLPDLGRDLSPPTGQMARAAQTNS